MSESGAIRYEDGNPHESHRWSQWSSETLLGRDDHVRCSACDCDIEDDEAVEPCRATEPTGASEVEALVDALKDWTAWTGRELVPLARQAADNLEALAAENERLRREAKITTKKLEAVERMPFCSDHRDKLRGKPCRECEIERLQRELARLRSMHEGAIEGWVTESTKGVIYPRPLGSDPDNVTAAFLGGYGATIRRALLILLPDTPKATDGD